MLSKQIKEQSVIGIHQQAEICDSPQIKYFLLYIWWLSSFTGRPNNIRLNSMWCHDIATKSNYNFGCYMPTWLQLIGSVLYCSVLLNDTNESTALVMEWQSEWQHKKILNWKGKGIAWWIDGHLCKNLWRLITKLSKLSFFKHHTKHCHVLQKKVVSRRLTWIAMCANYNQTYISAVKQNEHILSPFSQIR